MANALYDLGRQAFLEGNIAWLTDDIKLILVDASYVANLATDEFLNIISGGDIVATSGNFSGKTSTAGVADADNVAIVGVSGNPITQIVIYQDTGSAATSRLIARIDVATGLPFNPSGGDVVISFDNGVNRIYKL